MSDRRSAYTGDELLREVFPPARYAVRGLIAQGLNLLVGPPKVGKSWIVLSLAISVATGARALGRIDCEAGDVLYLALEDPPRRLQRRLRMLTDDDTPSLHRLSLQTEWPALNDGGAAALDDYLVNFPETRLVVVDVLAKLRGHNAVQDGNRYDADYDTVAALKTVADRHNVAVVVVHHTRKQGSDDFLATVSGTHGLAGAADAVLVLGRARNSNEAKLSVTGRDIEEAAYAMSLSPETGAWTMLDTPVSDVTLSPERRRVRDLLRAEPHLTPTVIAERLDITVDNAKQTVRRMLSADQLHTDGAGHYTVPETAVTLSPLSLSLPVTEREISDSDRGDNSDTPTPGVDVLDAWQARCVSCSGELYEVDRMAGDGLCSRCAEASDPGASSRRSQLLADFLNGAAS